MQLNRPMTRPDGHRAVVSMHVVTGCWPDTPLTFLRGALRDEIQRMTISVGQGKRTRYDRDHTAYDEELYALADWADQTKSASREGALFHT